jgi:transposase
MAKTRSQISNIVIKKEHDSGNSQLLGNASKTAKTKVTRQETVKTRSQASNTVIKKEHDCDNSQLLGNASRTTKTKVAEPVSTLFKVKLEEEEEEADNKSLLQLASKSKKRTIEREERIKRFISCITNNNMTIKAASKEINVSYTTGLMYYKEYLVDQKLCEPSKYRLPCTDQQIKAFIRYVVDDGMTIRHASSKASMTYNAGIYHFRKYAKDPKNNSSTVNGKYTQVNKQEKGNEAIGYIVNDNMSQEDAAYKAGIARGTVLKYYRRYLKENGNKSRISKNSSPRKGKTYTQEHVKKLIDYIVNDNMNIDTASKKVDMGNHTARRYYRQYLDDPQRRIPMPKNSSKRSTHAQIRKLIGYIVNDKMSMLAASIKADLRENAAKMHYLKYLNDPKYKKMTDKV